MLLLICLMSVPGGRRRIFDILFHFFPCFFTLYYFPETNVLMVMVDGGKLWLWLKKDEICKRMCTFLFLCLP